MKSKKIINLSVLTTLLVTGCVQKGVNVENQRVLNQSNSTSRPLPKSIQQTQLIKESQRLSQPHAKVGTVSIGTASWYGEKYHGRTTAYGEKFDMMANTAAHKTLPYNTLVKVTDMVSGKSLTVRINDKGPFVKGRIIDLSKGAAERLGFIRQGTTDVRLEVVGHASGATMVKGVGCQGGVCYTKKIAKAPKDTYAGVFNAFNKPFKATQSKSLVENTPQNRIVTDEVEYIQATQQNKVEFEHLASSFKRDQVGDVAFTQKDTLAYDNSYQGNTIADMMTPSSQISIQVGAFRNFAGATQYANRYSLLDQNHKANIKKHIKDAQPLYRVQIEGFSSDMEAREFMSLHNLKSKGAFLVRR